ncbi:unnamed protein product, partial [Mesorhabditis belari]|uniref:BRCT domain-containing protein n=1 Tax=Mesorhabditis belari TaxID=2138241 RepID=A0AAF3F3T2_9BILA
MTQTPISAPGAPRKPKRSSIVHVKDVPPPSNMTTPSASKTDDSDVSCDLFFLHPTLFVTDRELLHREVFKKCEEAGLDPKWVEDQAIKKVKPNDHNFYILHQFEGPSYEMLKNKKCKTISSFLVRECLREETPLPKINVPIYSKHLNGVRITFTGFTTEEKERLTSLVFAMGGHVSPRFSERITHMVANGYIPDNAGKYRAAKQLNVPIMDVSWLEDAWLKAQAHEPFNCASNDFVREHQMPLFKGLVITKTGISQAQMTDLIRAIEINGGKYSPSLTQQCTHMITESCSGDKYRKVKDWEKRSKAEEKGVRRVYLVNLKWLMKSIEAGYIQPESRYDPERPTCSTPTHEAPIQDLELSAIAGQQNGKLDTQINYTFHPNGTSPMDDRLRRLSNASGVQASPYLRTPTSGSGAKFERNRVSALRREARNSSIGGESGRRSNLQRSNSASLLCQDPTAMLNRKLRELNDPVENLGQERDELDNELDTLEGTRILIIGASNSSLSTWKRVLNCLGACRVTKIMADTLVVIVRIFGSEDEKKLREAQEVGVVIVKAEWVLQCLLRKDQISTNEYLWSDYVTELERQVALELEGPRRENTAGQQDLEFPTKSGITTELNSKSNFGSQNQVTNENETVYDEQFTNSKFLAEKTFRIFEKGMEQDDMDELKKEIHNLGGTYTVATDNTVDYLIFPLIEFGTVPAPTDENVEHIVTGFWLRCCITTGKLLEPNESPLFRPIPACAGSTIFKGLVVSVTGLDHALREEISTLVEEFGGIFQTSISRVDKANNKKNTHVIAGNLSAKTKTSIQWGIKVMDPSWVVESVINDRLMPETMFPVGDAPFATYKGRADDVWQTCEMGRFDVNYEMRNTVNTQPQNEGSSLGTNHHVSQPKLTNNKAPLITEEPHPSSSSSKFLDSQILFKPRFRLDGLSQVIDGLPTQETPGPSIGDTATAHQVSNALKEAVEKTGTPKAPLPIMQTRTAQLEPENKVPPLSLSKPVIRPKRDYALASKMHEDLLNDEIASTTDGRNSRSSVVSTQTTNQTGKRRRLREPSQNDMLNSNVPFAVADPIAEVVEIDDRTQTQGPSAKQRRQEIVGWMDASDNNVMKRFDESLAQQTPASALKKRMSIKDPQPRRDVNAGTTTLLNVTKQSSIHAPKTAPNLNVPSTSAVKHLQAEPIKDEVIKEEPLSEPQSVQPKRGSDWCFSYSSIPTPAQLHELDDIVKQLGGRSSLSTQNEQLPSLYNRTTHLVTGRLIRNEKCLSAIAIGAYLLVPEYLEDSKKQDQFLEVEPYDWKTRVEQMPEMKQREKALAEAAIWWREHLTAKRNGGDKNFGAFTGWRALIYSKPSKADAVIRIIKCGGGEAVCRSTIESVAGYKPTHALVENCQFWNADELMLLIKCRARAFPFDYTANYLSRHGRFDISDTLEDYRRCLGTMPSNRHH